jgi:hypothetical protein
MGTNGLFGFYYKGKYYIMYNHYDSYYSGGLGENLFNEVMLMFSNNEIDIWIEKLQKLKIISDEDKPTEEDIEKCSIYTDLSVSHQSTSDWYCLLRKCQGSLKNILDSGYLLIDSEYESEESLKEECFGYIYVLDFDNFCFNGYFGNSSKQELIDLKTGKTSEFMED